MGSNKVVIGASVGVAIGLLIATCSLICVILCKKKKHSHLETQTSDSNHPSLPICMNNVDTSIRSSTSHANSDVFHELPPVEKKTWFRRARHDKDLSSSMSGTINFPYRDIQKATKNFTAILGQGSFGPVYKAIMPVGMVVAVKVLSSNSRQGEREFQTEVLLLSRLHHRNLVNLVGYCVEKGKRMLVYEFMSNGSLASRLYSEGSQGLSWDERLQIALDVIHGIEYLHEGAVPPVIHRDLKPSNILLNQFMRAKVADFGLSKEEIQDGGKSSLKGTYDYMDPDYMTTGCFTKKSDIYSFGLIMFELITAISPQHGLTEYIDLAAIGGGHADWEEILDKKLVGKCDLVEVGSLASIAYKCLHKNPRKRPSTADIVLAISRIKLKQLTKEDSRVFPRDEAMHVLERIEKQQVELRSITIRKDHPSSMA